MASLNLQYVTHCSDSIKNKDVICKKELRMCSENEKMSLKSKINDLKSKTNISYHALDRMYERGIRYNRKDFLNEMELENLQEIQLYKNDVRFLFKTKQTFVKGNKTFAVKFIVSLGGKLIISVWVNDAIKDHVNLDYSLYNGRVNVMDWF